jgi:hypothetical protein
MAENNDIINSIAEGEKGLEEIYAQANQNIKREKSGLSFGGKCTIFIVCMAVILGSNWLVARRVEERFMREAEQAIISFIMEADTSVKKHYNNYDELPAQHPDPMLSTVVDYLKLSDDRYQLTPRFNGYVRSVILGPEKLMFERELQEMLGIQSP